MTVDKTKPAWITPDTEPHVDALVAAGAGHPIRIGTRAAPTWRDAVKRVRPGDQVHIWALVLIPTRRGVDFELPPVAQPREIIREIEARGGVLIEVYTGRTSAKTRDKSGMIADAVTALKGGGRKKLPAGHRAAGRRPREWTKAEMQHAERVWRDVVKYPTWGFAQMHLPDGFTAARALRLWGPRGAAPARKRK